MSTQGEYVFSHEQKQEVARVATVALPHQCLSYHTKQGGKGQRWAVTQDEATWLVSHLSASSEGEAHSYLKPTGGHQLVT